MHSVCADALELEEGVLHPVCIIDKETVTWVQTKQRRACYMYAAIDYCLAFALKPFADNDLK